MVEQINEIIDSLADKLGVAVSEICAVMEAQAGVEIVKSLIGLVICLVVLALCGLYVYKVFIKTDKDGKTVIGKAEENYFDFSILAYVFLTIGTAVLAIIMCVIFAGNVSTIIQCIMNPRYWVLKEIFKLI